MFAIADTDENGELSQGELSELTVAQLKALAQELGIELTTNTKAEIIGEILTAQAQTDNSET